MTRIPLLLLLCVLTGAAPAGPAPAPAAGDGFAKFLAQQQAAAKAASRKRDHAGAAAAWMAVLELDPRALSAFAGLAEATRAQGDRDAEAFWLTEWIEQLVPLVADGDPRLARDLDKARARLTELDPLAGRAEALLAEYGAAQGALAAGYLEAGLYANALAAAERQLAVEPPASAGRLAARALVARVLSEGGDDVAGAFDPATAGPQRDEEWIAEHDRKTAKWGSAARWETPHYRTKTNAGWRIGSEASTVMEKVHAYYREVWGIVPDPPPRQVPEGLRDLTVPPIDLNIYADRAEYLKRTGSPEWSGGVYTGSAVETWDTSGDGRGSKGTLRTLFHEASHQFMDVAVGDVPSFVNEGIACLFEGIELLSNGSIRRDLPVPHYLVPLAAAIRDGTALSIADVTGGTDAGKNEPEFYKYRWGVMYFLRMYVDEQGTYPYRDRQLEYIWSFKRGAPGNMVEHFSEFFVTGTPVAGIATLADFEERWRQWILALDEELRTADKRLDEYRKKGRLAALKGQAGTAANFWRRALEIDPEDLDALLGLGEACDELGQPDRALASLRRFVDLAPEDDPRRAGADARAGRLDPLDASWREARRSLSGGMAALALEYEQQGLPRLALRSGRRALLADRFDASARALVDRLERETGLSVDRWQRLDNGFDLSGWYAAGEGAADTFRATRKGIESDTARLEQPAVADEAGASLYQTLFVDRAVDGDWTLEARIVASEAWEIAGLVFGARDADHFEAIVLRRTGDEVNNVDFGSFDGGWTFRGDGSVKANYDARQGVVLRIEARGPRVAVRLNGDLVRPIVDRQAVDALKYPLAALRGDVGLLASRGVTLFSEIRLQSGAER